MNALPRPSSLLHTAELLLRNPPALIARIREGDSLKDLPLQLTLIAVGGFASFGFLLGLTHSPVAGLISAPKLVAVGLGSLAVCLPSLHVYGRLLGNPSGILQVACEALTALATTGMTLLALCPVWLAYAHLVGGPPNAYFHVMLGAVAFLAFAGVRGTAVLLGALRLQKRAALHLAAWTLLYGMVGLQAAWMLRPFVGTPTDTSGKLALFRPLDRSAFDATWNLFGSNVNSLTGQRTLRQAYPFSRDRGE